MFQDTGRSMPRTGRDTARLREKALRMREQQDKVDIIAKKLQSVRVPASASRSAAIEIYKMAKGTADMNKLMAKGKDSFDLAKSLYGQLNRPPQQSQAAPAAYQPTTTPQLDMSRTRPTKTKEQPKYPTAASNFKTTTQRAAEQMGDGLNLLPQPNRVKADSKDIWNEISEFNRAQQEMDRVQGAQKKKAQTRKWQGELQFQMQEAANQKKKEEDDMRNYARQKAQELEKWKRQEQQKAQSQRDANLQQKRLQDQQRRLQDEQKAREERQRQADDQRQMNILKKQMQDDIEKDRQRKMAEKAKMERVKIENQANLKVKMKKKEEEQHYAMKLAADYEAMENKKEADRAANLKAMSDRIQAKMNQGASVIAEQDNRERDNEERAKREQAKYNKQREAEESRRRKAAKERTETQLTVLKKQVREREDKLAAEQREMLDQASIWKHQVDDYDKAEEKKLKNAKQRNKSQQKWLERQIIEKSKGGSLADQSALELQMNRGILNKIGGMKGYQMTQSSSGMSIGEKTRARSAEVEAQQAAMRKSRGNDVMSKIDAKTRY